MTDNTFPNPIGSEQEKTDLILKACNVKNGLTPDHMDSFKWSGVMGEFRNAQVLFKYEGQLLDVDVSTNGEPSLVMTNKA